MSSFSFNLKCEIPYYVLVPWAFILSQFYLGEILILVSNNADSKLNFLQAILILLLTFVKCQLYKVQVLILNNLQHEH